MIQKINDLIKECENSRQPVLSAFVSLKGEDHSFKKLKSLFNKAQNTLSSQGRSIDRLDQILLDGAVSGRELNLDLGLGDTNAAIYISQNQVRAFKCSREFNDDYIIGDKPFLLPLIRSSLSGIKAFVAMNKFVNVYEISEDGLTALGKDFPLLDENQLKAFEENASQDRSEQRRSELVKKYINEIFEKAKNEYFDKEDKILVIAKEEFISHIKKEMENSLWKRSHVVEKHNFQTENKEQIEGKILSLINKNKINHYKANEGSLEKSFHTLNRIRKELSPGNIQKFYISDSRLTRASKNPEAGMEDNKELNTFVLELMKRGVEISAFRQMEDNYGVEVKNLDEGKSYTQA